MTTSRGNPRVADIALSLVFIELGAVPATAFKGPRRYLTVRRWDVYKTNDRFMPRVSDEHKDAVRQRILDAADRCFDEKGYEATSIRDILAEAGLSAGALYSYFASKEQIVAAVAQQVADRESRVFHDLAAAVGHAGQGLATMAIQLFRQHEPYSHLPAARIQAASIPAIAKALNDYDRMMVTSLAPVVSAARAENELVSGADGEALIEVVQTFFEGLEAKLRAGTFTTSYERIVATFLEMMALSVGTEGSKFRELLQEQASGLRSANAQGNRHATPPPDG